MPTIATQTDPCFDVISQLNEEFDSLQIEKDSMESRIDDLQKGLKNETKQRLIETKEIRKAIKHLLAGETRRLLGNE